MKTLLKLLSLPILLFLFSCEEVVDIELETATSRLVVNAPLEWEKGTDGRYQSITLTTSAGFYASMPPIVSNAMVSVMDSEGNIYLFTERETPGQYECFDFQPQIFGQYELEIIYMDETYRGTEILYPVADFDESEQVTHSFTDLLEIRAYFTDPEDEENYYMLEETSSTTVVPGYQAFNDKFFNGQQNYASHFEEDLVVDDYVKFKIFGISSRHHDYLFKLTSSYQGGPFQTVSGLLRGNMINETNPENFALGYFSLSETATITQIIE